MNIFNKRIPTIFGLLAIFVGIGITSFLTNQGIIFTGQASPSNEPKNVLISNISDNSFTVTYTTDDSVLGSLNVGQNVSLGTTTIDDRDKTPTNHTVHVMTVKNLSPGSSYFFSITSGQDTFLNNGVLFNTKTGAALDSATTQRQTVSGKVLMPDGTSPLEAVIYINITGGQTLSVLAKADGSYNLPLTFLRTADLSAYYALPSGVDVKLSAFGDSLVSQASLSSDQINDIPTITLSKNYDFRIGNSPINSNSSIISTSSATQSFPTATPSSSLNTAPQILTPQKDQEFSDDQPQFKGKAQPNQDVDITIHSDSAISAKVVADANGNWTYRPDTSLAPGTHTISITTRDAFGILKAITQQFTVFASGSQVSDSATPSATLTPTVTPTPTLTPTLTITPIATQTPTPIITEFITPTLTPAVLPTTALPATGSSTLPTFGIIAAGLIIVGTLLFIFTRMGI